MHLCTVWFYEKAKTAKWKWYTPKKVCILPTPLVTALKAGTTTLSAKGKWTRLWATTGTKSRRQNESEAAHVEVHSAGKASSGEITVSFGQPLRARCALPSPSFPVTVQSEQVPSLGHAIPNRQHFLIEHRLQRW